jgi:hypothetical protein
MSEVKIKSTLNNMDNRPSPHAQPQEVTPVTADRIDNYADASKDFNSSGEKVNQVPSSDLDRDALNEEEKPKGPWWKIFLEPGSAPQIITAAVFAIALGLGIKEAVGTVPQAAITILGIPGVLWLRALKAVGQYILPTTPII